MAKKLESLLLGLFLLLLPSQLALHLWPSWSFVAGLPIDYLAPTLYLTDLLLLALLLLQLPKLFVYKSFFINHKSSFINPYSIFILVIILSNIAFSVSPLVTLLSWLRLIIYLLFAIYLSTQSSFINRKSFLLGILWTCSLALLQLFYQHSLGGLWQFLGERPLSPIQPAVAKIINPFSLFDIRHSQLLMRPYATFPHPNALAGFLLASFWLIRSRVVKIFLAITLFITFSRAAVGVFVLLLCLQLFPRIISNKKYFWLLIALATFCLLSYFILHTSSFIETNSVQERFFLFTQSLNLLLTHPLGVGLSAFIPALGNSHIVFQSRYLLQPVHNIYNLLLTELGLPLIVFFVFFIKKIFSLHTSYFKLHLSLLSILLTGFFDHYWLTSHQNQLLLLIVLSFLLKPVKSSHTAPKF